MVYRPGGAVEVEADECRWEGAHVVLVRWEVVVMWPREVVVQRVRAADVERVEQVPRGAKPGTAVGRGR